MKLHETGVWTGCATLEILKKKPCLVILLKSQAVISCLSDPDREFTRIDSAAVTTLPAKYGSEGDRYWNRASFTATRSCRVSQSTIFKRPHQIRFIYVTSVCVSDTHRRFGLVTGGRNKMRFRWRVNWAGHYQEREGNVSVRPAGFHTLTRSVCARWKWQRRRRLIISSLIVSFCPRSCKRSI